MGWKDQGRKKVASHDVSGGGGGGGGGWGGLR